MASKRNVKAPGRATPASTAKKSVKKAAAKPLAKKTPATAKKKPAAVKKTAIKKKPVAKRPTAKAAAKTDKTVKKPVAKAAAKKPAPDVKKPAAKAGAKTPTAKTVAAKPAAPVVREPAVPARPIILSQKSQPTLVSVTAEVKPPVKPVARPHLQLVASKPAVPIKLSDLPFKPEDYVVYPTHGVGRVTGIETQEISGMQLTLFVVHFEKDKMTLRVPVAKANTVGMRRLSSPDKMRTALKTLKGRARVKRTMWSRRAQEYEAKINSGDPISIAEVVRDLHRNAGQPEQSYSERQIYEAALDRLARELAAVERIDEEQATQRLEKVLRAA